MISTMPVRVYHFGWLNLPETPNIFVLAPSLGLTHKKNTSNHAQGAYLFTVLCGCMTLLTAPLYKLGLLNFWLWPISSLLIHLPATAHDEPPSIGKARIEACWISTGLRFTYLQARWIKLWPAKICQVQIHLPLSNSISWLKHWKQNQTALCLNGQTRSLENQ